MVLVSQEQATEGHNMSTNRTSDIAIGDGATYSVGSDRYPATVIAKTPGTITVQDDNFTAAEGHNYFGAQKWTFSPNPNGATRVARWSPKFQTWVSHGTRFYVGHRDAFQNPSF